MRFPASRIVVLGVLSCGALAGCVGREDPPVSPVVAPPGAHVLGTFVAHLRPKLRSLTIERVGGANEAASPGLEPQSLDGLPIVNDGTSGTNPANTVELVTNSVDDPYPTNLTFSASVTMRHFYARSFANVFVQVASITDTMGNPLANHDATNSDSPLYGLSNDHGLWQYTATGAPTGVLGESPYNEGTRDWTFGNPDDAETDITLIAYASLGFGSYTFGFSNASYVDACSGGTSSTSPEASATLPFNFSLFSTNDTAIKFSRNGQIALGSTALTASGTSLALPSSSAPHPALFTFWDDIDYGSGGMLCYQTVGSAPNRQFVVEWRGMDFRSGPAVGSSLDFEALLSEGTGNVDLVYNTMMGTDSSAGREAGAQATVGIQDEAAVSSAGENDTQDFGSGNAWSLAPAPF